jgi:hypothetical protein
MLNFSQGNQNVEKATARTPAEPRRVTDQAEATPVEIVQGPIINGQQSVELRVNGKPLTST